MLSPDLLLKPGVYPPHLPANYLNFKFVIAKIRHQHMGLNSTTTLVFYINTQTMVWIDPAVGIAKNEILIK
jgi:hypothetical protein